MCVCVQVFVFTYVHSYLLVGHMTITSCRASEVADAGRFGGAISEAMMDMKHLLAQ